jgi:hypothetical protein
MNYSELTQRSQAALLNDIKAIYYNNGRPSFLHDPVLTMNVYRSAMGPVSKLEHEILKFTGFITYE